MKKIIINKLKEVNKNIPVELREVELHPKRDEVVYEFVPFP
jgi:hypothetical protein